MVIVIDKNKIFLNLNKTCKYCPYCELLIAKKQEIEDLIKDFLGLNDLKENDYFIFGTIDKKIFLKGMNNKLTTKELIGNTIIFQDIWNFEMTGRWIKNKG